MELKYYILENGVDQRTPCFNSTELDPDIDYCIVLPIYAFYSIFAS